MVNRCNQLAKRTATTRRDLASLHKLTTAQLDRHLQRRQVEAEAPRRPSTRAAVALGMSALRAAALVDER